MSAEREHPYRTGHGTPVSHDDAQAAAQRLINSHFNNRGPHARTRIPADYGDDDIVICDYISQRREADRQLEPSGAGPRTESSPETKGTDK